MVDEFSPATCQSAACVRWFAVAVHVSGSRFEDGCGANGFSGDW